VMKLLATRNSLLTAGCATSIWQAN